MGGGVWGEGQRSIIYAQFTTSSLQCSVYEFRVQGACSQLKYRDKTASEPITAPGGKWPEWGFARTSLGQWFSNSSVLNNDSKNFLDCRVQVLVSDIQTSPGLGQGPRTCILVSFPLIPILVVSRFPFEKFCLMSWWLRSRLCPWALLPEGFRFLGFVCGDRCACVLGHRLPYLSVAWHPFHYLFSPTYFGGDFFLPHNLHLLLMDLPSHFRLLKDTA